MHYDTEYSRRVRQLIEEEGLTNSDAQAIADIENLDDSTELDLDEERAYGPAGAPRALRHHYR